MAVGTSSFPHPAAHSPLPAGVSVAPRCSRIAPPSAVRWLFASKSLRETWQRDCDIGKREEVKQKYHDKVTVSSQAASERSRKKQHLLAAEAKGLAGIPEKDLKDEMQGWFSFLICAALTLSR